MNRRRSMIALLALGAGARPPAVGQSTATVRRIGYLSALNRESVAPVIEALLRALAGLGWIEGSNLVIDYRWADGSVERLDDFAADLVARKVELIIAASTTATLAAKRATGSIPIVMVFPTDPVGQGLVASLRHPGGNVTGTSFTAGPEIFAKQLQILREVVPSASRIAVLSNPADRNAIQLREVEAAAPTVGVQLQRVDARTAEDLDRAFAAMAAQRTDALLVGGSSTLIQHRARIAQLALAGRLPTMANFREMVDSGCLLAYGIDMGKFVAHTAVYVDKVLKGARPAELPVEQPTEFELAINLKTAKVLRLTIPATTLARANVLVR